MPGVILVIVDVMVAVASFKIMIIALAPALVALTVERTAVVMVMVRSWLWPPMLGRRLTAGKQGARAQHPNIHVWDRRSRAEWSESDKQVQTQESVSGAVRVRVADGRGHLHGGNQLLDHALSLNDLEWRHCGSLQLGVL
jgi:hypothetical protein